MKFGDEEIEIKIIKMLLDDRALYAARVSLAEAVAVHAEKLLDELKDAEWIKSMHDLHAAIADWRNSSPADAATVARSLEKHMDEFTTPLKAAKEEK